MGCPRRLNFDQGFRLHFDQDLEAVKDTVLCGYV